MGKAQHRKCPVCDRSYFGRGACCSRSCGNKLQYIAAGERKKPAHCAYCEEEYMRIDRPNATKYCSDYCKHAQLRDNKVAAKPWFSFKHPMEAWV